MEQAKHEIWWPLHLRKAQGKPLNAEEQTIYEEGLHELYAEEPLDGSIEALRHSRQRVEALKAVYLQLQAEYESLEAEIKRREARLSPSTRQLLGVGD